MPASPRRLTALIAGAVALASTVPALAAHATSAGATTAGTTTARATAAKATAAVQPVVSRGVTIPAFYVPPATLPAANGAVIRSEPLKLAISLPGLTGPLPGRATRLMYKSTDSNGRPVAVTGAYFEPTARWRGPGARPLVVLASGTMGQGDQCAPSLGVSKVVVASTKTFSGDYENLAVYRLLNKGVAVVETDYVGLGTTDRLHTYVNRLDEGHAVLDAARAVRQLRGTSVTARSVVGLYGYSQGGGAVAAAAELQPTYAKDVPLRGTAAGAPPANLLATTAAIDGTELAGALAWAVNGFVQSDPSLQPLVDKYLSPSGAAVLKDLSTACAGDAMIKYANKRSSAWTTNGASLATIISSEPKLRNFVGQQQIGTLRPTTPVRVSTGVNDNMVPHAQARTLAVDWCRRGATVVYQPVRLPKQSSPTLNHLGPMLSDQGAALGWLTDRLSGKAVTSTCSALPTQP